MTEKEYIARSYHALFDYHLTRTDLARWLPGEKLRVNKKKRLNTSFTYLKGKQQPKEEQEKKMKIAKAAAHVLSTIPSVLFVGVTGSLAMNNAKPESDIDLMIITKSNTVWTTRIVAHVLLFLHGFSLRRAKNSDEKDKLCLNFWIDEESLLWNGPQNAYTAHEIAQVVPLINKTRIYSRWIKTNDWITQYWSNALKKSLLHTNEKEHIPVIFFTIFNYVLYIFQKMYMSSKITREQVGIHFAFFHPFDWGNSIKKNLMKQGIREV